MKNLLFGYIGSINKISRLEKNFNKKLNKIIEYTDSELRAWNLQKVYDRKKDFISEQLKMIPN
ncbi:hypothetical protein [Mycoplasma sp. 3686d]|uniref:hypothetical protein n=1 Tax=Mycoplasma sp. 3686d TaxID=2967300 RepID=UPI00211C9A6F|nr:hypothetical protein [Mycoplasma sp. 3686d]UUM24899.1 hypothetical protein NPA12_00545 [Mycoplasma sp. 3686d]